MALPVLALVAGGIALFGAGTAIGRRLGRAETKSVAAVNAKATAIDPIVEMARASNWGSYGFSDFTVDTSVKVDGVDLSGAHGVIFAYNKDFPGISAAFVQINGQPAAVLIQKTSSGWKCVGAADTYDSYLSHMISDNAGAAAKYFARFEELAKNVD